MDEELKNRGWHELTFLDIAKSLKRGPFGGNLKKAFFVPTGYKVYEQQHAINKDFQLGTYFIDDKKYEELKGFAVGSGDYIISCSGTIGKLYRLPKEAPNGVINQALLKITLEDGLLTHSYFSYLFQSAYFQRQILSDARGTGMQNLAGMKEIKVVPVFIPPFPEQRKSVEKLDELISELDNGIANLKAAKDKLEIYRQAVLKKAFEGELTSTNLDSIAITELGKILTGNTPTKKDPSNYDSADYYFYKPTDLDAGNNVIKSNDFLSKKGFENSRQVPAFSILVTCIGATIGKTGLIKSEGGFNQQINAIVPFENYMPEFIFYQAIGIDFQTQIKTNASSKTLPILNKGKFSKLRMSVCSKDEQHQIVQEIESRLSVYDNILANIEEGLEKSEALRQSILKQAFEGKLLNVEELEACKQEPDWEPAEKLLERIKNGDEVKPKKLSHA